MVLLLSAETAFSKDGVVYVSAGVNTINNFTQGGHGTVSGDSTGYVYGNIGGNVAIGYDFSDQISLEVEYQQQRSQQYKTISSTSTWLYGPSQASRLSFKTESIVPRLIYRFKLSGIQGLSSYVGAGGGFYKGTANYDENINHTTDAAVANGQVFQMLGGIRYHMNEKSFLELRVQNDKFSSITASSAGVLNGSTIKSHNTIGTVLTLGGYL
jgi:hypothetical protein